MDSLLGEVEKAFASQLSITTLLSLSKQLQVEFKEHLDASLKASPICMLPTHNYVLPSGEEVGTYLTLEVGGSNVRVASVDLPGRAKGEGCIRESKASPISIDLRKQEGLAFFDWIAERIGEMLAVDKTILDQMKAGPLHMGIAWAFPIDQTSLRSGNVLEMGKGFGCSVKGQDLGEIIMAACQRAGKLAAKHLFPFSESPNSSTYSRWSEEGNTDSALCSDLQISLDAISNDTCAVLLSRAYVDPATRMAMVLGTGFNAAVHLPRAALNSDKFKSRAMPTNIDISRVLVNTELSLCGKDVFEKTRWDDTLNDNHFKPDFQPLEYLVSGSYICELVRLIMLDATGLGLFGGVMPSSLKEKFTLTEAKLLGWIEIDASHELSDSRMTFHQYYPITPTPDDLQPSQRIMHSLHHQPSHRDMLFLQQVIRSITQRSSMYVAAAIHALASLLEDMEKKHQAGGRKIDRMTVACDGSIINLYPGYMSNCQVTLDKMFVEEDQGKRTVALKPTTNSAIVGAAIGAAMASAST